MLGVGFNELDLSVSAASQPQVIQRLLIDKEHCRRGAVFRCHVGDRRTVGQRQMIQTFAEEFDEFVDHPFFTQHLRDSQNQIGCSRAFR